MTKIDQTGFHEFVGSRLEMWRRAAYLLSRDWHGADDLVGITVGRLYRNWSRACAADNIDAYVHGMLAHAFLDERRRPWRRERAEAGTAFNGGGVDVPMNAIEERETLLALVRQLPPRRRAVVVLRFYCDLSVAQTAAVMGLSEGTVKSQCARGLDALRNLLASQEAGK
jgi:RNA polymerase sigma-70 factor (sigma-E family)